MKQIHQLSLILPILLTYLFVPFSSYGSQLVIYALDVGQGDSTLIVTPSKQRILIDGGRDISVVDRIDNIIPFWDREIDLVMLSHPDADHVAGLIDVLSRYKVRNVALTPFEVDSEVYMAFKEKINSQGLQPTHFIRGTIVSTSDGVKIRSLWPTPESIGAMSSNSNSQVGLLSYGPFRGLLTGDIDTEVASYLDSYNDLGNIDYLKVPHHGSKNNLTLEQLKMLSPEISSISVGANNSYGHPSTEIISNLIKVKSKVLRTDTHSTIRITVNQSGISVSSE